MHSGVSGTRLAHQLAHLDIRKGSTKEPFVLRILLLQHDFCFNSRGGTRTPDPVINSHLLYQLSYSGSRGKN
jgi:hypothetical protein